MLFHEIYSSYYRTVEAILSEAVKETLTASRLRQIVSEKAFGDSTFVIPDKLLKQEWYLLDEKLRTPLKQVIRPPVTLLQKRWMKSILMDPRIRLFSVPEEGLEEVKPLFDPSKIVYYDRYLDGDPFTSEGYIRRFQMILACIQEKKQLLIAYEAAKGGRFQTWLIPHYLEYSSKDDKFRLYAYSRRRNGCYRERSYNLSRIQSCTVGRPVPENLKLEKAEQKCLILKLKDERDALNRAMYHFSDLRKETEKIDGVHYHITLYYDESDQTEMVIRILQFGPMVEVIYPDAVKNEVAARLMRQMNREKGLT